MLSGVWAPLAARYWLIEMPYHLAGRGEMPSTMLDAHVVKSRGHATLRFRERQRASEALKDPVEGGGCATQMPRRWAVLGESALREERVFHSQGIGPLIPDSSLLTSTYCTSCLLTPKLPVRRCAL